MQRGTELVLFFKDLSNTEENEWETTTANRARAEQSKHSCPTWAAARALLWSCRFRASWSWAAFRSWCWTWIHAATGMKEGQLMERGGIWHLWSKTDGCSHLGILELGVNVMMSFPQLFIFLPQVKHTVCKPKARHVKDRTQHCTAEHEAAADKIERNKYLRFVFTTKTPKLFLVRSKDGNKWRASILQPICFTTFELGDFQLFDLLQFVIALSVFVQLSVVVVTLGLVLVLQVIILLLQILMLVLTEDTTSLN